MARREPSWWYETPGEPRLMARMLAPIGALVGRIAEARLARGPHYSSKLPVVCVGNFTVGGTGKTPHTDLVVRMLGDLGHRPVILTRGYGGSERGPLVVDRARHRARDVGDEPLLHSASHAVVVSRNRADGARFIEESGLGTVIVMDDGMQNPELAKDLVLALVDGRRGFGNGRVMPAGPLRCAIGFQLGLVDCVIVTGGGDSPQVARLQRSFSGPVLASRVEPRGDAAWLQGQRVAAFAGIANPDRFFSLLESLGATVVERFEFGDHAEMADADARRLLASARAQGLTLVTTEKDFYRLQGAAGALGDLAGHVKVLPIAAVLSNADRDQLRALIEGALARRGSQIFSR